MIIHLKATKCRLCLGQSSTVSCIAAYWDSSTFLHLGSRLFSV